MYNTSKYFSYIYADRNVRPCTIQGYTLATFPNIVQYIYAQPEKQAKEFCRLSFGGYLWSCCCEWPHQFIPCLVGGVVNSQLIEVGDDMSGRVVVSLMVQCPGGWLPAVLYARHCQVHISLMPKDMHQRGGFDLQGLSPCIPLPSVGCLSHSLKHAGVSHKPMWLSQASPIRELF